MVPLKEPRRCGLPPPPPQGASPAHKEPRSEAPPPQAPPPVLEWRGQDGLVVVVLLLLLAQDLQLQEELLLLEQARVVGVQRRLALLAFLVWWNVLVVLQLLHPGFGVFALFAAVLVVRILGVALLFARKRR